MKRRREGSRSQLIISIIQRDVDCLQMNKKKKRKKYPGRRKDDEVGGKMKRKKKEEKKNVLFIF